MGNYCTTLHSFPELTNCPALEKILKTKKHSQNINKIQEGHLMFMNREIKCIKDFNATQL